MSEPRNILVIRLDRLGDLVCSTPFLKTLRKGFPGSRITLLLRPYTRELLLGCSFIDELLTWPEEKNARPEVLRRIRREKPDLAIALSPIMPAYRLAWQSGAGERVGYVYRSRWTALLMSRFMLTRTAILDIEGAVRRGEKVPHEVEQALVVADLLGLEEKCSDMEIPIPDEERILSASFLMQNDISGKPLLGLHLHQGWFRNDWSEDDFLALIGDILEAFSSMRLLLTCGPQEKTLVEKLRPNLPGSVIVAEGFPIRRWAALISSCMAFVSLDTGATHVAAALGVPTVCVFQPDTFRLCSGQWAPWKVPCSILEMSSPDKSRREIVKALENLLPSNI